MRCLHPCTTVSRGPQSCPTRKAALRNPYPKERESPFSNSEDDTNRDNGGLPRWDEEYIEPREHTPLRKGEISWIVGGFIALIFCDGCPSLTSTLLLDRTERFVSKRFQWLPSDFTVSYTGKMPLSSSHINRARPTRHADLYTVIPKVLEYTLPMFERMLSDPLDPVGYYGSTMHPPYEMATLGCRNERTVVPQPTAGQAGSEHITLYSPKKVV
jgi:hypothetical protein